MRLSRLAVIALSLVSALFVTVLMHYEYFKVYVTEPHVLIVDPFNQSNIVQLGNNTFMVKTYFPVGKFENLVCFLLRTGSALDTVSLELDTTEQTDFEYRIKLCGFAVSDLYHKSEAVVNGTRVVLEKGILYVNQTAVSTDYSRQLHNVYVLISRQCALLGTVVNVNPVTLTFNISTVCSSSPCYPVVCIDLSIESYEVPRNVTLIFTVK